MDAAPQALTASQPLTSDEWLAARLGDWHERTLDDIRLLPQARSARENLRAGYGLMALLGYTWEAHAEEPPPDLLSGDAWCYAPSYWWVSETMPYTFYPEELELKFWHDASLLCIGAEALTARYRLKFRLSCELFPGSDADGPSWQVTVFTDEYRLFIARDFCSALRLGIMSWIEQTHPEVLP